MSQRESRQRRRPILILLGLAVAIPLLYRVFLIYRWRPGTCMTSTAPVLPQQPRLGRESGGSLRVATWNIEGHAALVSSDHTARIAETIRGLDVDVIALQEVHRGTWQARFRDQLAEIAGATGMNAAWSPSYELAGGFGNAILTRGTIVSAHRIVLPGIGEPRSALVATIDVGERRVRIVSTHLVGWSRFAAETRGHQITCLLGEISGPVIVAGDLNEQPGSAAVAQLTSAGFRDADLLQQPTHRLLETKIDYLLHRHSWRTLSARVHDTSVSDHRPLVAEIEEGP